MSTVGRGMSGRILALALAGLSAPVLAIQNSIQTQATSPRRRQVEIPTANYGGYGFNYSRGPGWTVAQVKRMAKKARNQRRHKIACRGRA